ncbi:Hypothetical predicted protein [Cloeon dipterum]|uniref:G-protein coupled receptors family 1 profile domain-containing protein n=1 Tax=Cloeon dipterum TaxID=197152 RepID=A0A8S1C4V4_9INSE|nr:Hypothetical predicted protein [Cloeon dipterum]
MASGLENNTWWCCNGTDLATTVDSPATFGRDKHEINTFYFYETEQFTLLWTLFALIVLGNSAVLAALLYTNKGRKSRMNFFIMQLALADLSVGLISVLTDIIWRITVAWNAGNAACKFIRFLQVSHLSDRFSTTCTFTINLIPPFSVRRGKTLQPHTAPSLFILRAKLFNPLQPVPFLAFPADCLCVRKLFEFI